MWKIMLEIIQVSELLFYIVTINYALFLLVYSARVSELRRATFNNMYSK